MSSLPCTSYVQKEAGVSVCVCVGGVIHGILHWNLAFTINSYTDPKFRKNVKYDVDCSRAQ